MNHNREIMTVLAKLGISKPNEMQRASLEADKNRDMMLLSPTGSGKTLAFLLPLLAQLKPDKAEVQAVVIAPARELALQIESVFRSLGTGLKVNCCYGGHPIRTEKKSLQHPPALLIGTPGRLLDHLERENINLESVDTLILDEFDKSLELGFTKEMRDVIKYMPNLHRRILTSATQGVDVPPYVGMVRPVKLSYLDSAERLPKGLSVFTVQSPVRDKLETLYGLLGELDGGLKLVFCNLREAVERVGGYLADRGVANELFHGGMEQIDREAALSRFRNGSSNILICTDLAARGLDIPDVEHVIHYHMPLNEEAYIHRSGRTARMEAKGNAFLITNEIDTVPEYIDPMPEEFFLPKEVKSPVLSPWITMTINRGKRDKLSKKDVVGFLYQKGALQRDDLGMVEVKERCTFVAVQRSVADSLIAAIAEEKIKGMRAKFTL